MEESTYFITRIIFQRSLAAIYFIAYLVAFFQFIPLCGEKGLAPIGFIFKRIKFYDSPSIFFLYYSDNFAKLIAALGIAISLLAILGITENFGNTISACSWLILWICYLSFVNVGQVFYGFGWESLLLETGFLAIFLGSKSSAVPIIVIYLLRWTLFRVMFGAGMIKIRADECWRDLTCLYYHFETQPVPNPLSPYFHRLPKFLLKLGVAFNHFVELIVPFFYFSTSRFSSLAGLLTVLFQGVLILSGNLSFLNYLTIVISISCFDDHFWSYLFNFQKTNVEQLSSFHFGSVIVLLLTVMYLSIQPIINLFSSKQLMNTSYDPLRLVNSYGAFGSVSRKRMEIILEGTSDETIDENTTWKEYEFKVKPGDITAKLPLMSPYHYRLDWQMWFAAMSSFEYEHWLQNLVVKLLANDQDTLRLIKTNPFREIPPNYIRGLRYEYCFNKDTGNTWVRTLKDEFFSPLALK